MTKAKLGGYTHRQAIATAEQSFTVVRTSLTQLMENESPHRSALLLARAGMALASGMEALNEIKKLVPLYEREK
jgi:hypothetical protein